MDSFGLAAMADSQQRVGLARALACQPQVLLLDEPFAALNPMLRGELRRELAQVAARWQVPVLMITHDVDDVLALADTSFIVEGGRAVREVNITQGQSRQALLGELLPGQPVVEPESAHARAARHLLEVPLHA